MRLNIPRIESQRHAQPAPEAANAEPGRRGLNALTGSGAVQQAEAPAVGGAGGSIGSTAAAWEPTVPLPNASGPRSLPTDLARVCSALAPISIAELTCALHLLLPRIADSVGNAQLRAAQHKIDFEAVRQTSRLKEVGLQFKTAKAELNQAYMSLATSVVAVIVSAGLGYCSQGDSATSRGLWAAATGATQLVNQGGEVISRSLPWGLGPQRSINLLRLQQADERQWQESLEQAVQMFSTSAQQVQEAGREYRRLVAQVQQNTTQVEMSR